MEIRLLEAAQDDLREGWRFYEMRATGLGDYFLECIQSDVRSLSLYAGIHEVTAGFHRMLSRRFPFTIYYLIEDKRVDVYAVLDCRRDPDWVARRLGGSRSTS